MKYSKAIEKIENILSEHQIGLMKISDASTVTVPRDWSPEEGIPCEGIYRVLSIQIAIPVNK